MLSTLRSQHQRVHELAGRLKQTRIAQARTGRRLKRRARHWLGRTETLAGLTVVGYLWAGNVQENRRDDRPAAPLGELLRATWIVAGWHRLPSRLNDLIGG